MLFHCVNYRLLPAQSTEIIWDTWGVPHIYATNKTELFHAFGWAQMQNHGNLILELFAKSRGEAAAHWGEDYLENDQLVHTLRFPEMAQQWVERQEPEMKAYLEAFVQGMNAYARAHPNRLLAQNQAVLPLNPRDVMAHYLFVVYTRFVGGQEFGQAARWQDRGSNTYAIGPSRSASGKAMLVQNPHLPWTDEFTWMEAHLNAPGLNLYGATLVGFPTIGIGFNEHLGWSHTNNTIDNADLYELTLEGESYRWEGKPKALERSDYILKIKQEDGTIENRTLTRYASVHGPVLRKGKGKALAIRLPGYDRPQAAFQWWKMGNARNLEEFQAALKMMQIPFFNVMYADRNGNIFYMFNGLVPRRASGDWGFWSKTIPGDQAAYLWQEVHAYEDLPKISNPASGWLQNANDPPWTSTFPRQLQPGDFPAYMAPVEMDFRPQRAVKMVQEDPSISFEELIDYKHSTRMEMADRLLDDLFLAIEAHGGEAAREAKAVLEKWDRQANAESRGAWLFYVWANRFKPWLASNYAQKWSLEQALSTPDGLANPKEAVTLLEQVVQTFKEKQWPLDVAWGERYRIRFFNKDLPGNGVDGGLGVFRVAWGQSHAEGTDITGGDSWVGVIAFGEKIQARVLLSYGNTSQPDSPHYGDQLELFSKKELREAWFYRNQVEKHRQKTEVRLGEGYKVR
ncbi:MAG: acylase [Microscillaceae bacterium]